MGRLLSQLFFPFLFFLYAFLRWPAAVNGADALDPPRTQIPRHLYHSSFFPLGCFRSLNSGALLKEVEALVGRHPDKLTMETMRAGNKGYVAEIAVVTYNYVKGKIKDNKKSRVLLSFGQHGRELVTSEVALHLLSVLAGEQRLVGMDPTNISTMLNNLVIKVVPMENLNGRKLVEAGDLCERRNGRGVDLNRNWSVDWGKKEKDYDPYEENPGSSPFSEPEAQIMRKLSKSFSPHIWVNVHSGMEALFMPYDHKNETPDGLMSELMKSTLEDLNRHHFQDRCLVGHGGGSVGYLAHGTTTDYMHDIAKVPMSFTFEIYGDLLATSKDCFKMFNPVDEVAFKGVIESWSAAFLEIFETAPERLERASKLVGAEVDRWVSPKSGKVEGLELGMQELRTYFRLFMLSSVLLMFMFCSRISRNKYKPVLGV